MHAPVEPRKWYNEAGTEVSSLSQSVTSQVEIITLGMGCFWGPEALFGQLPGVERTRVGYAGGTTEAPTYREMGDHTETVEVVFDPRKLTLQELLTIFWSNHNPSNINEYKGRQYQSLLLYRNEEQRLRMEKTLEDRALAEGMKPDTEIAPLKQFHEGESRHQKYYLKRYPDALEKLSAWYPTEEELIASTLAARLNGLAKGYTNLSRIIDEVRSWPIPDEEQQRVIELVRGIKW
jgi:peptide-methionine (S)-S-oxide reductase